MTLQQAVTEFPAELYHIGCHVAYICVVTREEFEEHIKHWSLKERKRIMTELGKQLDLSARGFPHEYTIKTLAAQLAAFIPYEDRQVEKIYKRVQGGITIIVSGDETGKAWDRSDYIKLWDREQNAGMSVLAH